jgi:glycosyltransferase involved in cell wall biosynthesis
LRCPSLTELPPPAPGKTGWPWTEESLRVENEHGQVYPCITIVTPSFNQGRFIEETIRSILLQGYPDLEYFILDGGSTDDSVEVIKKYSDWIDFWVSESDGGQSAAINRGLEMGSGTYATWINSDDMLCKNALTNQALSFGFAADLVYIGDCVNIDETVNHHFRHRGRVTSFEDLVSIPSIWVDGGYISQPGVLFPLELALSVGGLNEQNHLTMDYELWGRFFLAGAKVQYTGLPFGYFRRHDRQKTQANMEQTKSMLETARALVFVAEKLSPERKEEIIANLDAYWAAYPRQAWKATGRLAKMGLPPSFVTAIRNLKNVAEKSVNKMMRKLPK